MCRRKNNEVNQAEVIDFWEYLKEGKNQRFIRTLPDILGFKHSTRGRKVDLLYRANLLWPEVRIEEMIYRLDWFVNRLRFGSLCATKMGWIVKSQKTSLVFRIFFLLPCNAKTSRISGTFSTSLVNCKVKVTVRLSPLLLSILALLNLIPQVFSR